MNGRVTVLLGNMDDLVRQRFELTEKISAILLELELIQAEEAEHKRIEYAEYLQSPEWRAKADACKEAAGHQCQLCNVRAPLQAHHRTYERLGGERPADLVALCDPCHKTITVALDERKVEG